MSALFEVPGDSASQYERNYLQYMVEFVHPCRALHTRQLQEKFKVYPVFRRIDVSRFQHGIVCFKYGEKRCSVFFSERGSDDVLQDQEFCLFSIGCLEGLPTGV